MIDDLLADGPAPDRRDRMGLYAFLVGRWEMDAVIYKDDGTTARSRGEIHADWALGGRAIQDVWMLPGRDMPDPGSVFYGTTLRVYDPGLDAWHILWNDPVKQLYTRQIGRARGNGIVQEGADSADTPMRWSFTEITHDSFHWLGERSLDQGKTWQLQVEFFARRAGA